MTKKKSVRDAMIDATASLIRQRGVAASGMQDIVAEAAAPRGSIYHHFPGGKDELVVAALDRFSENVVQAVDAVAAKATNADNFVAGIAVVFRAGSEKADWDQGCPIAATAIEGDRQSAAVRQSVAASFRDWQHAIAQGLDKYHVVDAREQALMIITALEGGLLLSRGLRSPEPYDAAVALLLRAGMSSSEPYK